MCGGIGTKLRIFFIITALSYISYASFGQEFYIGGKKCIGTPATGGSGQPNAASTDCNEPTMFFDTKKEATGWVWDFGDPGTTSDVSTLRNPKYNYASPGTYTVTLTRTVPGGIEGPFTQDVIISTPPPQPQFFKKTSADTTVCNGKTLTLDPYKHLGGSAPAGATFLWFPKGETSQTLEVDSAGCYSVEVFDASGQCSRTAKITVKFCLQEGGGGGAEKWYFGRGATLEFQAQGPPAMPVDTLANSGDLFGPPEETDPLYIPTESTESNPVDSPEGVSMVYDPSNSLLFYTDGVTIFGKDDKPLAFMPPLTDSNLGGTNTSTQSSIIIPKGSCNECPHHLYYVYTLNKDTGLLSYSIVDLRRNNGQGAVVEKNIPLNFSTSQQIAAKKTQDESGFYIYTHEADTNVFRILKVDSTGTTEKTQSIGLVHDASTEIKGYMRLSPSGAKMAVAVAKDGKNYIQIFNINADSGELTLSTTIDLDITNPPFVYGLEFSQDEEKLYTTLRGDPATNVKSYLYQLNLNLKDPIAIAKNKIRIDSSLVIAFGALQMGPVSGGGKKFIYMAIDGSTSLPYIAEPDFVGDASIIGYQPYDAGFGAELSGTSHFGFPNVIQAKQKQDGEGINATFEGTCQGLPTIFETQGICSPMKGEVTWDFGDGSAGSGTQASHTYEKSGMYIIKMKIVVYSETLASQNINIPILGNALKERCNEFNVTDTLYIKPSPVLNLPDSAFVCVLEGATLLLDPKIQRAYNPQYLWTPTSETTPTITVSALGNYSVKATNRFANNTTCGATDKVQVKEGCEPRLFVPEIFTANGDGINEKFELPNAHITDFDLKIYNRWGEIIFESFEPEKIWDGTYKGKMMAPMMYAFVVSYKSKYFPYRPKITKTGGIMLIN